MRKLEVILLSLFALCAILFIIFHKFLLLVALSGLLLSGMYFFLTALLLKSVVSKLQPERIEFSTKFYVAGVFAGITYSMGIISIMFKLFRWPGSMPNLSGTLFFLTISTIICVVKLSKRLHDPVYKVILRRNVYMLIPLIGLFIISWLP